MFWEIIVKTIVVHTLTYFGVGATAFAVFNYTSTLAHPANNMKPSTDPLVRAGVLFQPIRGFLFGIVFYLLRDVLLLQANGWFIIWIMLVIVGVLSTFAPAASSIEGLIYLKSEGKNWGGLVEILSQSFLLSIIVYYWINHPELFWLTWLLGILFIFSILLPVLGLVSSRKITK
jgi:hypothetical protein